MKTIKDVMKRNKVAINFENEEDRLEFLNMCVKEEIVWQGQRLIQANDMSDITHIKIEDCISLNIHGELCYSSSKSDRYEYITLKDLRIAMYGYTKSMLENFDVVEIAKGYKYLVNVDSGRLIGQEEWDELSNYSEDLTCTGIGRSTFPQLDIVKVFKFKNGMYYTGEMLMTECLDLVWEFDFEAKKKEEEKQVILDKITNVKEELKGYEEELKQFD